MRFAQVYKEAYSLLTNTDVIRAGRAAVQAALLGLFATRMISDAGAITSAVFLGSGLYPVGSGAANTMIMRPGLALFYDSSEADTWLGQVKPIWSQSATNVTVNTNSDGSGHDRIDVLAVRAVQALGDYQDASFKTPGTAAGAGIYTKSSPHEQAWTLEHQVFEGTPAASPAVPSLPAGQGWVAVAQIARPNGQADVNPGDVTDVRVGDVLRTGDLLATKAAARVLLGDQVAGAFAGLKYQSSASGNLNAGELVVMSDAHDDNNPDGPLVVSEVKALNTPLALVAFGTMDFVGGVIPDDTDLPSQVKQGPISSIKWRTGVSRTRPINGGGTDTYTGLSVVRITLSEALSAVNNAVVNVNHQWRIPGEPLNVAVEVVDTTTIELSCVQLDEAADSAGDELELLTNLPDGRFMVTIYDLGRYS